MLDLLSFAISASSTAVDSDAILKLNATYFLSSNSTPLTVTLLSNNIDNYFPDIIIVDQEIPLPLNQISLSLRKDSLTIYGLRVIGDINSYKDFIITLTGFRNPHSNCSIPFTYVDNVTNEPRINLNLLPDQTSVSSEYYPLTIEIVPGVQLELNDHIAISEVILESTNNDCHESIFKLESIKDFNCLYTGNTLKLIIISFEDDAIQLKEDKKIVIVLNKVKYNSKMSPQTLTVTLQNSTDCTIAYGINTNSWIPSKPASLKDFTLNFSSNENEYTYNTNALILQGKVSKLLSAGKFVTIELIGTNASIEQDFASLQINILEKNSILVKGITLPEWQDTVRIILFPFILPINERPFQVKLTIYDGAVDLSSEIIYQQISGTHNAKRSIIENPSKVKNEGSNIVDEIGMYTITANISFIMTELTEFHYILPLSYNATEFCLASLNCRLESTNVFIMTNLETISFNDELTTLSFSARNPPTTKPITEQFNVIVYEDNYPSFIIPTYLDDDVKYEAGVLTNFIVENVDKSSYDLTIYDISFMTTHKVLLGSNIVLIFPDVIITRAASIHSITIGGNIVHASLLRGSLNTLTILGAFISDVTSASLVQIKLRDIRNPTSRGDYTGFSVTIEKDGYSIDLASGASISIITPGTIPYSYSLSNPTNDAISDYIFTLHSTDPLPNLEEFPGKRLRISKPMKVPSCDLENLISISTGFEITYISGNNPAIYEIEYPLSTLEISFKTTCTNPSTTEPTDSFIISLFLYAEDEEFECSKIEIPINTQIGSPLTLIASSINIPTYPSYITKSQLTIGRSNSAILINRVVVDLPYPLIPAPSPACSTNFANSYQCNSDTTGQLIITFNSPWSTSNLNIREMTSTNPLSRALSTKPFSIKSYVNVNSNYYIVEQIDNAGILEVTCTHPCKECLADETTCTSCANNDPANVFYLIKSTGECRKDSENVCDPGFYKNNNTYACEECESECKECVDTASYCTLCSVPGLVSMKGHCQESCDSGYFSTTELPTCKKCNDQCKECKNTETECTSCNSGHFLNGNECVTNCPETKYAVVATQRCEDCEIDKCYGCILSSTNCTSCIEGKLLEIDTHTCVLKCGDNHYQSDRQCIRCSESCLTCIGDADTCLSCSVSLYLHENQCVPICPDSTYGKDGKCKVCNQNCLTCKEEATKCTSCNASKVLDDSVCLNSCQEGKSVINGVCVKCADECKTCVGNPSTCQTCKNDDHFLYLGKCYADCPNGTSESIQNGFKVCIACGIGCSVCALSNDGTQICGKCESGFVLFNDECRYSCPEDYEINNEGTQCLPKIPEKNNYIPFPFLIAFTVYLVIPFAGWIRNPYSLLLVNIIIGWSVILLIAFIVQSILAIINSEIIIFAGSLVSVITTIIINVLFYFPYNRHVITDQVYTQWSLFNSCVDRVISILSYVLSFQVRRIYYSRFSGLNFFYIAFTNINSFLDDLNYFSMGFIIFALLPVCIIDVYTFVILSWGKQLFITTLETFIVSLILMCIILYEAKYGRQLRPIVSDETDYSTLTGPDNATKQKILDDMRQDVVSQVVKEINKQKAMKSFKKGKPERTYTMPELWEDPKKRIERDEASYPCSPKVRDEVYSFFAETSGVWKDLNDNVECEAVTRDEGKRLNEWKSMADYSMQTIPIMKIEEFKARLLTNSKPKQRKKRLFDLTNPYESVLELSKRNRKIHPGNLNPTLTPLNNQEDTLLNYQDALTNDMFENTRQLKPEEKVSFRNSHKTFLDGNKTPDIFNSSSKFMFSMVCLEKGKKETANLLDRNDIKDILGSFDRDESDAILINQTIEGKLIDRKGHSVNRFGYLIDNAGNIINVKGEFILSKEEFDKEIADTQINLKDTKECKINVDMNTLSPKTQKKIEFEETKGRNFDTLNVDAISRTDIKLEMTDEQKLSWKFELTNKFDEDSKVQDIMINESTILNNQTTSKKDKIVHEMSEDERLSMADSPSKYDNINNINYLAKTSKRNKEVKEIQSIDINDASVNNSIQPQPKRLTNYSRGRRKFPKKDSKHFADNSTPLHKRTETASDDKKSIDDSVMDNTKKEITPLFVSEWKGTTARKAHKSPHMSSSRPNPSFINEESDMDAAFKLLKNKIVTATFPKINLQDAFDSDEEDNNMHLDYKK